MEKLFKAVLIIIVIAILFLIVKSNSCRRESEEKTNTQNAKENIAISVDSSKLQIDNLIQKYKCDTTTLGDFWSLTYEKSEIMSKSKIRLFTLRLSDIYYIETDSLYVISGENIDESLFMADCEFSFSKNILDRTLGKLNLIRCVVKNPKIVPIKNYQVEVDEYYDENSEISIESGSKYKILGECIHMERAIY